MENVYQLIEKYVKLTYVVKILTGHCSKSDDFNTNLSNIDFSQLGLSDDILKIIGPNPDVKRLKSFITVFERLADMTSMEVFGPLSTLEHEEKLQIKDYLEDKVSTYLTAINNYQETYLGIVFEIDEACKEDNKDKVRELGKLAKKNYNKIYEYTVYSQTYSNLACYFKGMLGGILSYK